MPVVRKVKRLTVADKRPLRDDEIFRARQEAAEAARSSARQPAEVPTAPLVAPTKTTEPAPAGEKKE